MNSEKREDRNISSKQLWNILLPKLMSTSPYLPIFSAVFMKLCENMDSWMVSSCGPLLPIPSSPLITCFSSPPPPPPLLSFLSLPPSIPVLIDSRFSYAMAIAQVIQHAGSWETTAFKIINSRLNNSIVCSSTELQHLDLFVKKTHTHTHTLLTLHFVLIVNIASPVLSHLPFEIWIDFANTSVPTNVLCSLNMNNGNWTSSC